MTTYFMVNNQTVTFLFQKFAHDSFAVVEYADCTAGLFEVKSREKVVSRAH